MKVFHPLIFLLLLTLGCEGPAANSESAETPENSVPSPRTPAEGTAPPAAVAFTARDLEGTWKRTDYPYGTLEFRDEEVKINVGEGMPEPPSFQPYELADRCPAGEGPELVSTTRRYLVYGDDLCEVISVSNDTLRQSDAAGSYTITFVRQD